MYTAFGCPADALPFSEAFPTSLSFPDASSMTFTWETSALNGSDYTGRIKSIELPTGGTITYAYSGGTNGINCGDGSPATMTRQTPDGTWTYTHVPPTGGLGYTSTTTVNDPIGNSTVYTFMQGAASFGGSTLYQPYEIERQVYNPSSSLVQTVFTCYNNTSSSPSNCNPNPPSYLITEKDIYTTYPGVTGYSAIKTAYNSFGIVASVQSFDYNASTPTTVRTIQYGTVSPIGVPGEFCTSGNETNWYERSLEWREERSTHRSKS
jgi:hypothetical protein